MVWYEDDEMMRQWEDVCKEDERIAFGKRKVRAYKLKVCRGHHNFKC